MRLIRLQQQQWQPHHSQQQLAQQPPQPQRRRPLGDESDATAELAAHGWRQYTAEGGTYYHHAGRNETTWDRPLTNVRSYNAQEDSQPQPSARGGQCRGSTAAFFGDADMAAAMLASKVAEAEAEENRKDPALQVCHSGNIICCRVNCRSIRRP